jgi:hypothetical protein
MRAIAGALLVVAGAILWGAGAASMPVVDPIGAGHQHAGWAIAAGVSLVLAGLAVVAIDLRSGRPPDGPNQPPAP